MMVLQPDRDSAAALLSRRFRPALMAFFMRRIYNHAEAEDLTHEVLMRVTERGASLDESRPDGYIFQIATNLLRDRARRARVRTTYQLGLGANEADRIEELDPERVLQARQSLASVVAALKELPERTRTIFILFRLENMKHREIADMLGISIRTVEQHVSRASVSLRARLDER
ncbi:sigma-70 family RNA polymerase sigma factor [Sphingomonas sp. So64.6b]|nr:sigma-70 family RNA polymerase sigma factor [Sphingomonas sp. So64.6b]